MKTNTGGYFEEIWKMHKQKMHLFVLYCCLFILFIHLYVTPLNI